MGVCIFYQGRLRRPDDIQPFTDELEDICRSAGWEHHLLDDAKPQFGGPPFRGITINLAERCDTVCLLFREDGTLVNIFGDEGAFVKTQFAGTDAHITLCRLLHYLSDRWFEVFKVDDEGEFYETMNREELQRQIDTINEGIQAITEGLEASPLGEDETLESRLLRIMAEVQKRRGEPGQ